MLGQRPEVEPAGAEDLEELLVVHGRGRIEAVRAFGIVRVPMVGRGDELAVIPPVSGGAVGERHGLVALSEEPLDPVAIAERVRGDGDGALVVFEGVVREQSRGKQVRALVYEAYGSMAQRQIEQLAEEAGRRWPISNVAVVHRTGTLKVGEVSVVIAVAAPHRGEAFDACEWLIDELKRTVPIWKKEIYTEGEAWIEDRP